MTGYAFRVTLYATAAERQVQTLRSEGGKVFGHTLRVTYRFPATTRPFEVFDHYDAVVPSGWHVTDRSDFIAMMIPPPLPAPGRPPVVIGPLVTSAQIRGPSVSTLTANGPCRCAFGESEGTDRSGSSSQPSSRQPC